LKVNQFPEKMTEEAFLGKIEDLHSARAAA